MAKRYIPTLLRRAGLAIKQKEYGRAYLFFDAVMEHIIPPFALLTGLSSLSLFAALILFFIAPDNSPNKSLTLISLVLGLLIILGQIIYIFYGLYLVKAPRKVYQALLYAPAFIVWKIGVYVRVLLGRGEKGWVRTERNET